MEVKIMRRFTRVLIYAFLLFFLIDMPQSHAAEVGVVIDPAALDDLTASRTWTPPAHIKYCDANDTVQPSLEIAVQDLLDGIPLQLTRSDCAAAKEEIVKVVAVDFKPSSASVRITRGLAREVAIVVEFSSTTSLATLPQPLSSAWLNGPGGIEFIAHTCAGKRCTFSFPRSRLTSLQWFDKLGVSLAHHPNVRSAYKLDGTSWNPGVTPIGEWSLPAEAQSDEVTLNRSDAGVMQSITDYRVPYGFLFAGGPVECQIGANRTAKCASISVKDNGSLKLELLQDARTALAASTGASIELVIPAKDGVSYKVAGAGDLQTAFKITIVTKQCSFHVDQLTPLDRGMNRAEVILEIENSSGGCRPAEWRVDETATTVGATKGRLRKFGGSSRDLYTVEVDTTAGTIGGVIPLVFFYPDGTPVKISGQAELRADGRVPFAAPTVAVNTNVECDTPDGKCLRAQAPDFAVEFELTDTVAQGRFSLIRFNQISDMEQWLLRPPADARARPCRLSSDNDPGRPR